MDVCDYDIQELLSIILCLFWKILHSVSIEILGFTSNDWKIFILRFSYADVMSKLCIEISNKKINYCLYE